MSTDIEASSFREWMVETFSPSELKDIASHGSDCGWAFLTYTRDLCDLYQHFQAEIWDALVDDAEDFGFDSVPAFLASFNCVGLITSPEGLATAAVWYMSEREARSLADEDEE